MNTQSTLRGLAIATAVSVLAAPAASAAPIEQYIPHTGDGKTIKDNSAPATPAPIRVVQVSADSGFDWGDAGIGAGGLLALVAIASGALVAIRHRPATGHPAA